jgi:hypothetical protein
MRCVFIALLYGALPLYAQSSRMMNKLAEKPAEQILVFAVDRPNLTQIIEAAAWKMNYDSVVINSAQDKILLIRDFQKFALQYRILLSLAQQDSALRLALQGFWFLPPDSIPRYNKALKAADRELVKLFLHAITQEIALQMGAPLYDRPLPDKPFHKFMGLNLLNPGLGVWYMTKDQPLISKTSALGLSIYFGVLDLASLAFYFSPERKVAEDENKPGLAVFDLSSRQLGKLGILTFRAVMTLGYFLDRDYRDLKKSGYYFPKIARMSFDTKHTRYIEPSRIDERSRANRQMVFIETPWGFAFDGGATKYWYDAPTSRWLKNHYGAALALQAMYRNAVLTGRIKFWSITGKRDLPITADTLLQRVEFTANRGEVTLGYIFNFTRRLSLEPYVGYAQSAFLIFRDKEFRDKLKIPSSSGFTFGAFVNRELFTLTYLRCGASFTYTDYSKINPELGRRFYTFDVSLMFRGRVRKAKTL